MNDIQLGAVEARFADMIWAAVPVTTSALVKMAEEEFKWKRTTTHTVIKRLCEKGLFVNNSGTVTALLTRDEFYAMQSERIVAQSFSGSLPAFVAAFTSNRKLNREEADELRRLIRQAEEV